VSLPRFLAPQFTAPGLVRLGSEEAHHLRRVLRLGPGDRVELFNGCGAAATATIITVTGSIAECRAEEPRWTPRPQPSVQLATAVPKGERGDWLVEKLAELGVAKWLPLKTARSVVDPRASKLDRLRQMALAAAKQSGNNWLMEIAPVTEWSPGFLAGLSDTRVLFADPAGRPFAEVLSECDAGPRTVLIGPEGGWTDAERSDALAAHAAPIRLGPSVLRVETAAIVAAGLAQVWSDGRRSVVQ
jgi:16S rRNA (uracil1498-N3)-methyltransferase